MTEFLGLKYTYPVQVRSVDALSSRESIGLKRLTTRRVAQRYEFDITLEPTKNANLLSAHKSQHGIHGKFTLPAPQPIGSNPFTGRTATGDAGDSRVRVSSGVDDSVIGRFVTFGSDTKLYQIISRSGRNLGVYPNLEVAASGAVNMSPDMTAYYSRDGLQGVNFRQDGFVIFKLSVVEAL